MLDSRAPTFRRVNWRHGASLSSTRPKQQHQQPLCTFDCYKLHDGFCFMFISVSIVQHSGVYDVTSACRVRRLCLCQQQEEQLCFQAVPRFVHLFVNTFLWRGVSSFCWGISVKLVNRYLSCRWKKWKGFQGLGSESRSRSLWIHLLHLSPVSCTDVWMLWQRRTFQRVPSSFSRLKLC